MRRNVGFSGAVGQVGKAFHLRGCLSRDAKELQA